MKSKPCARCNEDHIVLYRIQTTKGKQWVFCCKNCTEHYQSSPDYKYGGTWKGNRH